MLISDLSYYETVTEPSIVAGGIDRTASRIGSRINPGNPSVPGNDSSPFVVTTREGNGFGSISIRLNSKLSVGGEEKQSDGGNVSISVVVGD